MTDAQQAGEFARRRIMLARAELRNAAAILRRPPNVIDLMREQRKIDVLRHLREARELETEFRAVVSNCRDWPGFMDGYRRAAG